MSINFSLQATFLSQNFPPQQSRCFMSLSIFLVVWNVYGGRKQETLSLGWAMPYHWSACAKLWLSVGTR